MASHHEPLCPGRCHSRAPATSRKRGRKEQEIAPTLDTRSVRPLRLMVRQNSGLEVTSRQRRRTMAARHRSSRHRWENTRLSRCSLVSASSRAASPSAAPAPASASRPALGIGQRKQRRIAAANATSGERNGAFRWAGRRAWPGAWAHSGRPDHDRCSIIIATCIPGLQSEPLGRGREGAGAGRCTWAF